MSKFPEQNNINFNEDISKVFDKYKIKEGKITTEEYCKKDPKASLELTSYQHLIEEYLSDASPYRGILVYHGLGSGKTVTAVAVAERNITKGVIILLPASLKQNFINETIKYQGAQYGAPKNYFSLSREEQKRHEKTIVANIAKKYAFIAYNAPNFVKQVEELAYLPEVVPENAEKTFASLAKEEDFDNKIIIIEEAHTFFRYVISGGAKQAIVIFQKMMNAKNTKFICLTGTPVVGDPFELAPMFNLLRGYVGKDSKGKPITLFPTEIQRFNEFFVDKEKNTMKNKGIFQDRSTGLVSYYRGIKDELGLVIPRKKGPYVVLCTMGSRQWKEYLRVRSIELDFERRSKYKKEKFMKLEYKKEKRTSMGTYKVLSRQVCNFSLPEYLEKKVKEFQGTLKITGKDLYKAVTEFRVALIEKELDLADLKKNIKDYSNKMHIMANNILKSKKGLVFVFSGFKDMGVRIFAKVLKAYGYVQYAHTAHTSAHTSAHASAKGGKDDTSYMRYAIIDGDVPEKNKEEIMQIFNSPENKEGAIIRVLLGTNVIASGVSLFNVRETHIMESQWRDAELQQIIGRAIRLCGHSGLPLKDRDVSVYVYLSVAPKGTKESLDVDNGMTSDQMIYYKALKEAKLFREFLLALQENAIDCPMNYAHNALSTKKDTSLHCRKCTSSSSSSQQRIFPPLLEDHLVLGPHCKEMTSQASAPAPTPLAKTTKKTNNKK